ncbi:TraB/GumN family protein [Paenibacillus sp. J5C_2022]|uniref:TraB/GumN family protein n=1 Tax=Paenibacillus sp. J5C2022 TaxID=2977129 RepID=UPI0021D094AF|nr:TraB/GumN family protein [Paenibacillus sp. J5C2022]MCU6712875.1 TraB/GumN family protein [Paenibacillus sp. J5C2022]
MKRKISALLLTIVMVLTFATGAQAQQTEGKLKVWLNGEELQEGDGSALVREEMAYVPIRLYLEELGFAIEWDGETRTATAMMDEVSIAFPVDTAQVVVNGQEVELGTALFIQSGTAYAPAEFMALVTGHKLELKAEEGALYFVVKTSSEGFMWKVQKGEAEVYLLGSIHLGDEDLYPLRPEIEEAFANSDILVTEIDMTKINMEEVAALNAELSEYSDGTILSDHISEDTYAKLQELLEQLEIPVTTFDPFKPWAIQTGLESIKAQMEGFNPAYGIDQYFTGKAVAQEMPIQELETIEDQLKMLSGFSEELTESMLLQSINHFFDEGASAGVLLDMWKNGDSDTLLKLENEMKLIDEYYEAMLVDRNEVMTDKVISYLNDEEEQDYFVIAGALHMLGEHGIVTMLEEQGYEVVQQ